MCDALYIDLLKEFYTDPPVTCYRDQPPAYGDIFPQCTPVPHLSTSTHPCESSHTVEPVSVTYSATVLPTPSAPPQDDSLPTLDFVIPELHPYPPPPTSDGIILPPPLAPPVNNDNYQVLYNYMTLCALFIFCSITSKIIIVCVYSNVMN